jgi:hypothetical protein
MFSQSAHNLENDAAELKVLVVRVLESNAALAERMSILESSQTISVSTRRDYETTSVLSQKTIKGPNNEVPGANLSLVTNQHAPIAHAFEEDLSKSWVYQRSLARGPRTFSIATSKRETQSWSILSGLSLSDISNIAVQALPIYPENLEDDHLYSFGIVNDDSLVNVEHGFDLHLEDSFLLKRRAGTDALISSPSLPQSTALRSLLNTDQKEAERMPKISKSNNKFDFSLPTLEMLPALDISLATLTSTPAMEIVTSARPHSADSQSTVTKVEVSEKNDTSSRATSMKVSHVGGYDVLYLAASLFWFQVATKSKAGYPYLTYEAGEVGSN